MKKWLLLGAGASTLACITMLRLDRLIHDASIAESPMTPPISKVLPYRSDLAVNTANPVASQMPYARSFKRGPSHPEELASELDRLLISTAVDSDSDLSTRFDELIHLDPSMAAPLVEKLPHGEGRDQLRKKLLRSWAERDANSAMRWAAQLSNESEQENSMGEICIQVAASNPAAAVEMADWSQLNSVPGLLDNLVQRWTAQDFSAAAAWIAKQAPGNERDQLIIRTAYTEARRNPVEATRWMMEQISSEANQSEGVISVLHQWALRDFPAATAWVNQFPPGELQARAQSELAGIARYRQQASQAN